MMQDNLSEKAKEINEYILNLDYNSKEKIAFKGTHITDYAKKSGECKGDKFIVITRERKSVDVEYDIAVQNSMKSTIYPGALLKADDHLIEGKPTPIDLEQAECKLTVDLPDLEQNTVMVKREYGAVTTAINKILKDWRKISPRGIIAPNLTFRKDIVTCSQDLSAAFGIDAGAFQDKLHASIEYFKKDDKSTYLVHFRQIYYNASVERTEHPVQVFSENVEFNSEFKDRINEKTPPCYVKSVSYGREIYLLFTSTLSSQQLKAHLDATFKINGKKIDAKLGAEYDKINEKIQCYLVVIGGKSMFITGSYDEKMVQLTEECINSGYYLTEDNLAEPIAYSVAFLKDNEVAVLKGTTDYILEDVAEYTSGSLQIIHNAAYIARFKISWREISYDKDGNDVGGYVNWQNSGKELTAGYNEVIKLPANATDLNVSAESKTGLVWQKWLKFFDRRLNLLNERTIEICGTTLKPYYHMRPADNENAAPAPEWDVYRGVFRYKGMQYEKSSLPCLIQIVLSNLKDSSEGDNLEELWNVYWRKYSESAPAAEDLPFYLNRTLEMNTKNCVFVPLKFSSGAESSCAAAIITEDFLSSHRPAGLIMGADDSELFYLTPQGEFIRFVPSAQAQPVCCDITPLRAVSVPVGDGKYGVALEYYDGENTVTVAKDFALIIL